jgi:hypothetical protein
MHRSSSFVLAATLGAVALSAQPAEAQNARAGAIQWWHGSKELKLNTAEKGILAKYVNKKCAVLKINSSDRAFFAQAAAHADAAIRSATFASILRSKKSFEKSSQSGAQVLSAITGTGRKINVFSYRRDATHPCNQFDLADGHTNAFTPVPKTGDVAMLFLFDPYLMTQQRQRDYRELARTIVHEALHAMGYGHTGIKAWTDPYMNTVPAYVGCVVQHWSPSPASIAWIKGNCHKAPSRQSKAPT